MRGLVAFVGGATWEPQAAPLRERLAEVAGSGSVVVVPAAAAYEDPAHLVAQATEQFGALGVEVTALDVLSRHDADSQEVAAAARAASFVYLTDGSAMHLRSVLKGSRLWAALLECHQHGGAVVASGAAATVLCDPMVDPRGGAYTVGLGLVHEVAVLPHHDTMPPHQRERSVELLAPGAALVGVDEATAVFWLPDGTWEVVGAGTVTLYRRGLDPVRTGPGPLAGLPA
jgi:cyanophycinase